MKVKASEVLIQSWKVVPYKEIEETLTGRNGLIYFVEGIRRQTAYSAARRLTGWLGFRVEAHVALYGDRKGYIFIRDGIEELKRRAEG